MRSIIEEPVVTNTIDRNIANNPRVEDVFNGLKWKLARDPSSEVQISIYDEPFFIESTNNFGMKNIPVIVCLYQFDANQVTIHEILIR